MRSARDFPAAIPAPNLLRFPGVSDVSADTGAPFARSVSKRSADDSSLELAALQKEAEHAESRAKRAKRREDGAPAHAAPPAKRKPTPPRSKANAPRTEELSAYEMERDQTKVQNARKLGELGLL